MQPLYTAAILLMLSSGFAWAGGPGRPSLAVAHAQAGRQVFKPAPVQQQVSSQKLMGQMMSNVSKTRSEISMTFARNSRG